MSNMFIEEWPETSGIVWWDECRAKLNKIIRAFNGWQIDGTPKNEAQRIERLIDHGLQTFASGDGCGGYREELEKMLNYMEATNAK